MPLLSVIIKWICIIFFSVFVFCMNTLIWFRKLCMYNTLYMCVGSRKSQTTALPSFRPVLLRGFACYLTHTHTHLSQFATWNSLRCAEHFARFAFDGCGAHTGCTESAIKYGSYAQNNMYIQLLNVKWKPDKWKMSEWNSHHGSNQILVIVNSIWSVSPIHDPIHPHAFIHSARSAGSHHRPNARKS